MGSVFRRGGTWLIKWKVGPKKWRQRRTTCATKGEAKELLRDLERKVQRQRLGLEPIYLPSELSFADLLDWYVDNYGRKHRSKGDRQSVDLHLRPSLGSLRLVEVTTEKVEEVLCGIDGLKPKSLNNLRSYVLNVFNKAILRGLWKVANPIIKVPRRKVPKRLPSFLKPDEVRLVIPEVPERWRRLFATGVYTGLRRGELVALQKRDVDLEAGTITVQASWEADTTKGEHADVIPIHPELRPYLAEAIKKSTSRLVFPREDGSMHSRNIDLPSLLRSAMNRAGLVDGWTHKCRRCAHKEGAADSDSRKCPKCGFKLWPSAVARRTRFHDLRHTTATLLLKAGAPLAVVQRILRHRDPRTTARTYGHLDVSDMQTAVELLSFAPEEWVSEEMGVAVVQLPAVNALGAPVVHGSEDGPKAQGSKEPNPASSQEKKQRTHRTLNPGPVGSEPTGARLSRAPPVRTGSHPIDTSRAVGKPPLTQVGKKPTRSTPVGAPVVRSAPPRMMSVREVAELLAVSKATVYALIERRELDRIWVGSSMRIPASSVDQFLKGGSK